MQKINIIGAGLAGSESALYLASKGYKVNLFDIKTKAKTPAHHSDNFAEIVCSNSFKSDDENSASGLFKRELLALGSRLIESAYLFKVPAGQALAVDREQYSAYITKLLKQNENINIICEDVSHFETDAITIVATGPLTTSNMSKALQEKLGQKFFYFYDAAAPIIDANSIDLNKAFFGSRYGKGEADYLNCPMDKQQYLNFYNQLIQAERVELHDFEKNNVFESCMPIEIMANRGEDAIRFGPLKPVGFTNPHDNSKPYALVQLRKENNSATMYNMVGFQTNLTFPEQKRVFSLIPGLENATFLRYGVMHTNHFVNFPACLDEFSRIKTDTNIFIAGQLSGVEGYVESIASGLYCAINVDRMLQNKPLIKFSADTIIGGLYNYLANANINHFQPINANYGIINPSAIRDKTERNTFYRIRSLNEIQRIKKQIEE